MKLHLYTEDYDFSLLEKGFQGEISSTCPLAAEVLFVDEEEIQALNKQQRGIDAVTDVLSFPTLDGIRNKKIYKSQHQEDVDEEGNLFLGSIVICTKRCQEQAEEYGHSYERELYYLTTHGLCHLLGFDHIIPEDQAEMREKEERILKKIGRTREQ